MAARIFRQRHDCRLRVLHYRSRTSLTWHWRVIAPRPYCGDMKFIKSENDTYFPGDPHPVWANLARTFEVETVSGNHLDMVTTHFEGLAAALTRYLSELHY